VSGGVEGGGRGGEGERKIREEGGMRTEERGRGSGGSKLYVMARRSLTIGQELGGEGRHQARARAGVKKRAPLRNGEGNPRC